MIKIEFDDKKRIARFALGYDAGLPVRVLGLNKFGINKGTWIILIKCKNSSYQYDLGDEHQMIREWSIPTDSLITKDIEFENDPRRWAYVEWPGLIGTYDGLVMESDRLIRY